ncbi:alpha/beta fold hydrolase [Lysinibacillus sp. NPDC093688]|uniref:alpha/beta fold hydrolase n=1 Tax=Lysinibacillus sp. NPDC093688 TaxID=3390577 RepID=UPI003D051813
MRFIDRWANSEKVKIHYLESADYNTSVTPLVYVPGALNFAEQSTDLLGKLLSRKCITMSLRGRGNSDAPKGGYSFDDHVKDLHAIISDCKVKNYCLMAYSMGVPYAIKFASEQTDIKGLIICDYPAKYPYIPETWSDRILNSGYLNEGRRHVVTGIQKESRQIDLYSELSLIKVPVLIIKGGTDGSLLKEMEVEKYRNYLNDVNIIEIASSGHELWEPDLNKYLQIINEFLEKLDSSC